MYITFPFYKIELFRLRPSKSFKNLGLPCYYRYTIVTKWLMQLCPKFTIADIPTLIGYPIRWQLHQFNYVHILLHSCSSCKKWHVNYSSTDISVHSSRINKCMQCSHDIRFGLEE